MSQRIILFGGAFDPPHNGHLAMAQMATDRIKPDKLLWIPTAHPTHRQPAIANFQQRCEMLQLITEDTPSWEICSIEADREGPSYFIETLHALMKHYRSAEFYVLMGEDQFANFTHWHQWKKINEQATLLVMPRTGIDAKKHAEKLRVIFLDAKPINISSSHIRLHGDFSQKNLPAQLQTYLKTKARYDRNPHPR